MALLKFQVKDSGLLRGEQPGDLVATQDLINNLTTAGAGTVTAALLAGTIINRTGPTGAVNDTTDTAANIINNITSSNTGDTWRIRYINTVAFVITLVGGSNVTVVNPTINASSVKDFLVTITSSAPQSIVPSSTTNGSAVVTGMTLAQTGAISIGQLVSGTGIPGGTTVIGIQSGVGVTLSANATATNNLVALTFNPSVTITGIGQGLV